MSELRNIGKALSKMFRLRADITEIAVKLWDEGGTGDAEMLARAYLPEPPEVGE